MNTHIHSTLAADHSTLLDEDKIASAMTAGEEALALLRLARLTAGITSEDSLEPESGDALAMQSILGMVKTRVEAITGQLSLVALHISQSNGETL